MKRILICIGLALTSCGDREAENAKRCEGYGAKKGTDVFIECMVQLRSTDKSGDDAAMAAWIASSAISNAIDRQRPQVAPATRTIILAPKRPIITPAKPVTPPVMSPATNVRKSFQVPLVPRKR